MAMSYIANTNLTIRKNRLIAFSNKNFHKKL
jgi:hypothetical protein